MNKLNLQVVEKLRQLEGDLPNCPGKIAVRNLLLDLLAVCGTTEATLRKCEDDREYGRRKTGYLAS